MEGNGKGFLQNILSLSSFFSSIIQFSQYPIYLPPPPRSLFTYVLNYSSIFPFLFRLLMTSLSLSLPYPSRLASRSVLEDGGGGRGSGGKGRKIRMGKGRFHPSIHSFRPPRLERARVDDDWGLDWRTRS